MQIKLSDITLDVTDYKYLVYRVPFRKVLAKEMKRRITVGWKKFYSLEIIATEKSKTWKQKKKEVLKNCVIPAFPYDFQTWSLTENIDTASNMLKANEGHYEKNILEGQNMKRIILLGCLVIWKRTSMTDVVTAAEQLTWKLSGHMCRIN